MAEVEEIGDLIKEAMKELRIVQLMMLKVRKILTLPKKKSLIMKQRKPRRKSAA